MSRFVTWVFAAIAILWVVFCVASYMILWKAPPDPEPLKRHLVEAARELYPKLEIDGRIYHQDHSYPVKPIVAIEVKGIVGLEDQTRLRDMLSAEWKKTGSTIDAYLEFIDVKDRVPSPAGKQYKLDDRPIPAQLQK
jgi:hypothetical protein